MLKYLLKKLKQNVTFYKQQLLFPFNFKKICHMTYKKEKN